MNLSALIRAALFFGLSGACCDPAFAQSRLGDMKDPYRVAERAASCARALREGGKDASDPSVRRWEQALRFAGAWSAQYAYSLRAVHLVEGARDAECEADLSVLTAQFDAVINGTYIPQWKAAQAVNSKKKPVLDQGGVKPLSQAAWCAEALTVGVQAIKQAPDQFGFKTADEQGKRAFNTVLIRYSLDAQSWRNYTQRLAPYGSYSVLAAEQARHAFSQWEGIFARSSAKSYWLSFLTNEVTACDALTPAVDALMDPLDDDFE
jgi:hypothetical protein